MNELLNQIRLLKEENQLLRDKIDRLAGSLKRSWVNAAKNNKPLPKNEIGDMRKAGADKVSKN